MSNRKINHRERRLRIRSIRRNPPDLKKLAGALIELARAQRMTRSLWNFVAAS